MGTKNPSRSKSSGHDATELTPDDTVYITTSASGSTQTYHLYRDCRYLGDDIREKPFRHRPLSSSCCSKCQARRDDQEVQF